MPLGMGTSQLAFAEGNTHAGQAEPGKLYLRRQLSLPTYFSKDRDALAHDWTSLLLYDFPPDCSDLSGHQTNQGTQAQGSANGPAQEEPTLVL